MATAVQPRPAHQQRQPLRVLTATRPALERINELDALGASWRLALDAAQAALQAAPAALSPEALDGRATLLAAERTQTAQLLERLARDFAVIGWVSQLDGSTLIADR
jgi:multidrug resistance efflux pump